MSQLVSKLLTALNNLGRKNGTALPYDIKVPRGHNDGDRYIAEHVALMDYFRADTIYGTVNKEREQAKKRCIDLGIFGDFENLQAGETYHPFDNGILSATVTVNRAAQKLDETKLANQLSITLGQKEAEALLKKCRVNANPARIVKVAFEEP